MDSSVKPTRRDYILELFRALSVSSLVFIGLELIKPGLVIAHLSLNYWLFFWFLSGILVLYTREK